MLILITLIPTLALIVPRLHDIGQSGWLAIITFIPYSGLIPFIIIGCIETQQTNNQWCSPAKNKNYKTYHCIVERMSIIMMRR
ncbi:DUF805 domain-containing protein [Moellerella wisconsensis]